MLRCTCLMVLLCGLGCDSGPGTVGVEGVVRLDGKPLPRASLHFIPEGDGRDATATADEQGRFVLSTFEPRDGALPGSYKIVVTPSAPAQEASKAMTPDEALAEAAAQAAKNPPKSAYPGFPEEYTRADQTPLQQTIPATGDVEIDLTSK